MKKLLVLASMAILSACSDAAYTDRTSAWLLPPELSDCKIYRLEPEGLGEMTALVCPRADTSVSYAEGKASKHTSMTYQDLEPSNMTHDEYHAMCMGGNGGDICTRDEEIFHQALHPILDSTAIHN